MTNAADSPAQAEIRRTPATVSDPASNEATADRPTSSAAAQALFDIRDPLPERLPMAGQRPPESPPESQAEPSPPAPTAGRRPDRRISGWLIEWSCTTLGHTANPSELA